jgi:hypothetical protein
MVEEILSHSLVYFLIKSSVTDPATSMQLLRIRNLYPDVILFPSRIPDPGAYMKKRGLQSFNLTFFCFLTVSGANLISSPVS